MTQPQIKRLSASLMFFALAIFPLSANPVFTIKRPPSPDDISIHVLVGLFAFSLFIEFCIVIYGVFLSKITSLTRAIWCVLVIHLISYPITLLLNSVIGYRAEIFPLVFELWLFSKLAKASIKNSWHLIVIANLASFLLGIGLPYVWFHLGPRPKPTIWAAMESR